MSGTFEPVSPLQLPDWVPVPLAAEHLGISIPSVRRMVSRGELEARRFGPRLLRIRRASLEAAGRPIGGGR